MSRKLTLYLVATLILSAALSTIMAAPAAFTLTTPAADALVKAADEVTTFGWTPASDALTYDLVLIQLSGNVRLGEIVNADGLTPAADADSLTCATDCVYTLAPGDQAKLENGTYAWAVEAVNADGRTEASNSPRYFVVNTDPIELVVNGGFENKTATNTPDYVPWTENARTKSKIRCNDGSSIVAFEGECAFELRVNGGSLTQRVDESLVRAGDTLTLSAAINTAVAPAGTVAEVKINYFNTAAGASGTGVDRFGITLSTNTTEYDEFSTAAFTVDDVPKKIRVYLRYSGTTGRVAVDAVSLIVALPEES